MKIWFLISEDARKALKQLYFELAGYAFVSPKDDWKPILTSFQIESTEEIDKLMRQKPQWRRPPK